MKPTLLIFFLLIASITIAQITIDSKQSAEFYVKNVLIGAGIEVGEINHIGKIGSLGQFKADSTIIGIKSGIVLSTGNTDSILGPNHTGNYTSLGIEPKDGKTIRGLKKGDKDLNKIAGKKTKDISVLEFDFVPTNNKLEFNYVFASEEYPEYVGSKFNDVFAFFLSGPDVKNKNLAVLSDGITPISINTVNHKKNKQIYRKNGGKLKIFFQKMKRSKPIKAKHQNRLIYQLQFDGLTTVLKVQFDVVPYQKYHVKIAIADGSDEKYDSAVFIEAGSFVTVVDNTGKHYEALLNSKNTKHDLDSILGLKKFEEHIEEIETINEEFEITDIYFDLDASEIPDSSITKLNKLVDYLKKNDDLNCSLFGYTDNIGSKKHNQKLSESRAIKVLEYLVSKGIDRKRLTYQGHNFEDAKYDNSNKAEQVKNRRVEIILE